MHYWPIILSAIGMASLSQAAECYDADVGTFCINADTLRSHASDWCKQHYNTLNGDWTTLTDGGGNVARIGKIGNFENSQVCVTAYNNIMNCLGERNGGSWTANGASLNINFCAW
ncbi:hypothetical protein GGI42DRAFT_6097 [Trichoderma sp. SZMC 28013]